MLFVSGNDFDISSVCESCKKNPCLDKIWRKGKVKGAKFTYRLGGRGPFFSGVEGNLSFFGGKGGWISFRYKGV